nr:unnamed protein product [Trichobilharzia regenti]
MEQVRHGQESWAQFDDDNDSCFIKETLSVPNSAPYCCFPTDAPSFSYQSTVMINSHFPSLGLTTNQNLGLTSPTCTSGQLNDLSGSLLPSFASYHLPKQQINSEKLESVHHGNLTGYSQANNSLQSTDIRCLGNTYTTKWSSLDHSTVVEANQSKTTPLNLPSAVATTFNSINSAKNNCLISKQAGTDLWTVTPDQKAYYLSQFLRLQPDIRSKLNGIQSKAFFELSKLPSLELSRIWELSDLDRDGHLTLGEFCVAMHLVVYKLNGVPIPDTLPSALFELVESNWLSAKITQQPLTQSSQSTITKAATIDNCDHDILTNCTMNSCIQRNYFNPTMYDNTDMRNTHQESDCRQQLPLSSSLLYPSNHNHPHQIKTTGTCVSPIDTMNSTVNSTEFKQQQQRRWSISSQSDICSLAEGMMLFESKPNMDAQLKHPIPLRVRTLPSSIIPEINSMHNSLVSTDSGHHHQQQSSDLSKTYNYSKKNAFYTTADPLVIDSNFPGKLDNDNSAKPSPSELVKSRHYESFSPQHIADQLSLSTSKSAPPPPPRANLLLVTNIDSVDVGIQKSSSARDREKTISVLTTTTLDQRDTRLTDSQSFLESIEALKCQCDQVSQVNEQLAITLMKLQKDRIALKIFLERLMPLETI